MDPQIIVLDEPTAGLDPGGVRDLIGFLNELPEKYGMTILFSTHLVELVPEIADYVYVMDKGSIVAEGNVSEIFQNEELLTRIGLDVPVFPTEKNN